MNATAVLPEAPPETPKHCSHQDKAPWPCHRSLSMAETTVPRFITCNEKLHSWYTHKDFLKTLIKQLCLADCYLFIFLVVADCHLT